MSSLSFHFVSFFFLLCFFFCILFPFSQAASVANLPSALFVERLSLGVRWVYLILRFRRMLSAGLNEFFARTYVSRRGRYVEEVGY